MTDPQAQPAPTGRDVALVQRAQAGDFSAFEELVGHYERRVYTLALRIVQRHQDAEEVVQDTFVSVLEHLSDFQGRSAFATWLVRVATNHALKLLARRKARAAVPIDPRGDDDGEPLPHPQVIAEWTEGPAELAQRSETRELIARALDDIDEKYRVIFLLRDVEGFSTEETAQTLGITVANAKVRLLRARLLLRERLTAAFGDPGRRLTPHHEH